VANTVTVALDSNSLSALENVTVTVGAAITGTVTVGNSVTIGSLPAISGTVTVGVLPSLTNNTNFVTVGQQIAQGINAYATIPIAADWENANQGIGNLNVTATCVTSTNRIGVVTIGGGTVTIGAGTAQIGSVTASLQASSITGSFKSLTYQDISTVAYLNVAVGSLPALASGTNQIGSVTVGNSVTIGSLPALVAGTAQIGSVTASISGTVPISISSVTVGNSVTIGSLPAISGTVTANTFALQGTAVTTSNFTSTTASTVLASYNATREVLTIFNEGAGNLHVCVGATCTTVQYQVRLSAGDYYEVPNHQTTITHSAVFATAGTARICQVS
jgi:hypothetical protein